LVLGTEGTEFGVIRSANATAFNTGNGFYLTNENNGTLRIGNPTGNRMVWNGSSLTVNGTINATSGTFNNTITVGTDTNKISIVGATTAANTKIHSGVGTLNNSNTGFYLDASGRFSLGNLLT
jgi:hypothetical protein